MAVNDMFVTRSGDNATLTIQPLGTVVLMATAWGNADTASSLQWTDGVTTTVTTNSKQFGTNMKFLADNTTYFHIDASGAGKLTCICGIEVK
jgi:hypothetical protein